MFPHKTVEVDARATAAAKVALGVGSEKDKATAEAEKREEQGDMFAAVYDALGVKNAKLGGVQGSRASSSHMGLMGGQRAAWYDVGLGCWLLDAEHAITDSDGDPTRKSRFPAAPLRYDEATRCWVKLEPAHIPVLEERQRRKVGAARFEQRLNGTRRHPVVNGGYTTGGYHDPSPMHPSGPVGGVVEPHERVGDYLRSQRAGEYYVPHPAYTAAHYLANSGIESDRFDAVSESYQIPRALSPVNSSTSPPPSPPPPPSLSLPPPPPRPPSPSPPLANHHRPPPTTQDRARAPYGRARASHEPTLYPWDGEDRVRAVGHGAYEAMAPHLSGVPGDTPVEPVAMHRDYGPLYVACRGALKH